MPVTVQDHLVHLLSDMYSVEQQALAQLVSAPDIAGDATLAGYFRQHHSETEQQAEQVREQLEAHQGSPSAVKDAVMKLGGKGFLLFARLQPETPGRLVDHAYSYEAMEWAGYDMLIRFAQHAGDDSTVQMAREIRSQERAMMERLERSFDAAEEVSHAGVSQEKMEEHLRKHLAEVHAFEVQNIQLLEKSEGMAGNALLKTIYSEQLGTIGEHARRVEQRLGALGSDASSLKDAALAAAGLNWGLFFQAQSDTPAKLAVFVYAVLHLQIGGYELLKRTARRTGDAETERLCEEILTEKRRLAERLSGAFDSAAEATLDVVQT